MNTVDITAQSSVLVHLVCLCVHIVFSVAVSVHQQPEAVTDRARKPEERKTKGTVRIQVKNSSAMHHKMLQKRLFLVVTAVNIVSFGEGKAIQDWNFKFNMMNGASKTPNQLLNENSDLKANRVSGSNKNMVDRVDCVGDCGGKNSKSSCPYESKDLCLIFSLSKIAKLQIASLSEVTTDRSVEPTVKSVKNSSFAEETKKESYLNSKQSENDDFQKQTKSSNVHCRAVRDVYIPEVKQNLPAFACQFGNSTFILSSARFLQDRRSRLDINVNEDMFSSIKTTPKVSRSNEPNVIPALLVLNTANNDYRIEMQGNISNEQRKEENR